MNAGWDSEMLSLELADLATIGADLSTLGFSSKELAAALSRISVGLTTRTRFRHLRTSRSLGGRHLATRPHRVACGDSRDAGLVRSLLAGAVPQ